MSRALSLAVAAKARKPWRKDSVLPGFPLALGITLTWLSLIFLLPLSALLLRPWELGLSGFWTVVTDPRVIAALRISFGAAALAATINAGLGLLIAWVLSRYAFPGRRFVDALVDLPFALPTAVAGIALTAIYAPNGPLGAPLAELGIRIAYTPLGILLALIFVGLPFVVRTVQPVLEDLDREVEEAARTLGATPRQTAWRVVLPALAPALLTGVGLAFARAAGEYGSVIFIAGNMPLRSEIAPLLIVIKLEQFDYAGAAAVGLAMLALSFTGLLLLNSLQGALARRGRA
ncbi:sulfate ABC transporter permease subunit CysT [Phenylobacterium sp.]|uniref:sulfate ABC transporter permease subunit CysT n=1 Tax=Phenylobacterium sp. TaxID=1871053 RepID=UPI0027318815|nr:sulfate ABC transporter permease subunit CysT [Phenylobacterium sp.]MDP1873301.1 sulfate ABC transporter permease subunit CysT [Phenylobacterium sp.]MDP3489419.1 sulfate ABC transporter permease subunit CysT [Phenylobacterium sp.]